MACSLGPYLLSPGAVLLEAQSFFLDSSYPVPLTQSASLPIPSCQSWGKLLAPSGSFYSVLFLIFPAGFQDAVLEHSNLVARRVPAIVTLSPFMPGTILYLLVLGARNFLGFDLFVFGPKTARLDSWWAGGMILGSVSFLFHYQAKGKRLSLDIFICLFPPLDIFNGF